uniref:uncharacterized protein LOC100179921 isoform X1 n=1 Tax=Ciona intestinalis TaxID=7719 RepID=UPI0000521F43|nr:uncharacterized protein LOC100179921 isoform X1 [Ciona intestinalis]|eukprot:XP_002127915.1 uncharacterized protein LOC100179921 isoform X1 [Ciona intestinalis]
MSTMRRRKPNDLITDKGDDGSTATKPTSLTDPGLFSDDEEERDTASHTSTVDRSSIASTSKLNPREPRVVSFFDNADGHSLDDNDEIGGDIERFTNSIQIADVNKIDHAGLIKEMHDRFKKKSQKWEREAVSYTRWSFGINFFILMMQMCQMLIHQLAEIFDITSKRAQVRQSIVPRFGFYRRLALQDSRYNVTYWTQAAQCLIAALTALIAGLQMKLKLTEKAERYRRGAKAYGRLLRLSTYYLMLLENGGKLEDVTDLWREAMRKEGKWIPMVKTFMTM